MCTSKTRESQEDDTHLTSYRDEKLHQVIFHFTFELAHDLRGHSAQKSLQIPRKLQVSPRRYKMIVLE